MALLDLAQIAGGLIALYFGADWLVGAATAVARRLGVSPLLVGLTVVALGTSMPELFVGVRAALGGHAGISIGNVVGANAINIGLILGTAALIRPLVVELRVLKWDLPAMLAAGVLMTVMAADGEVGRLEGAVLLAGLVGFRRVGLDRHNRLAWREFTAVFTNKPIVTPVRGAGRQHGVFVMERLLDIAARELGIDRLDIRRRNYLGPDRFPHDNEIIFQDSAPLTYDSGNYAPALETAARLIDYERFVREEQPRLRAAGRHVGVGIVSHIEGTGIGPYEGARVTVEPSGRVRVATGVGTQGQGHFTAFAQIVAEVLDVPVDRVHVITGDTREFHWGTGTFASRGAVVAGTACHAAAVAVRDKIFDVASVALGVSNDRLQLADGSVQVVGTDRAIDLGTLAARANPLRGAVRPGTEPGRTCRGGARPGGRARASGPSPELTRRFGAGESAVADGLR